MLLRPYGYDKILAVDPVTHTLVGISLANAFFRPTMGKAALPVMALASNLPDIDALVHLAGEPAVILMRRTFGHSIFLLPIWSFAFAWIMRRFYPSIRLSALFGITLLSALIHLFFDLVNSFGVVPLWPLSFWRPELAIVFIIDLILTGILITPLLLAFPRKMRTYRVPFSRASIALVLLYLIFCGTSRSMAYEKLETEAEHLGGQASFYYVFPEPLGPHRWRGLLLYGNQYRVYLIHPLSGQIELKDIIVSEIEDPLVRKARQKPLARGLEWFFKAPVWTVLKNPQSIPVEVTVSDLRFRSVVIGRDPPFVFRFPVQP